MYVRSREASSNFKLKHVADYHRLSFVLVVSRTSLAVYYKLSDQFSSVLWEIHSPLLFLGLLVSDI